MLTKEVISFEQPGPVYPSANYIGSLAKFTCTHTSTGNSSITVPLKPIGDLFRLCPAC